jgi:hypothetical protein
MSELVFDGATRQISLIDSNGNTVGTWPANNIVERGSRHPRVPHLRFVPNGTHILVDRSMPHRHAGNGSDGRPLDSAAGSYGSHGIVRLAPIQGHNGIGVHSGRAGIPDGRGRVGPDHATQGCIRTTDEAMGIIARRMRTDALRSITVHNNHDQ